MSLAIDGKVDALERRRHADAAAAGARAAAAPPGPEEAAILGLGSGVTLGVGAHAIRSSAPICVEISPEVVEASHFFDAENHRALADPRTRLIVGDGRTHLLLTRDRYDVIVSEPSNPWMAGIASLFTREFFAGGARPARARRRALPVGAHLRHQHRATLQSIVATFAVGVSRRHDLAGRRRRRAAGGIERAARAAPGRAVAGWSVPAWRPTSRRWA